MIKIKQKKYIPYIIILIGCLLSLLTVFHAYASHNEQYSARNTQFIHFMLPLIKQSNLTITEKRDYLIKLHNNYQHHKKSKLSERKWLYSLAKRYKIDHFDINKHDSWKALLNRVNTIPPSLALAQSINESAWGTSRFAKQGHNYFGQWCYQKGCGLIPKKRRPQSHYEVATFKNPQASVSSYIHNLNTNSHYAMLRNIRAQQAASDAACLRGFPLTQGLRYYSSQGQAYVNSLKVIIKDFKLGQYDCPTHQPKH